MNTKYGKLYLNIASGLFYNSTEDLDGNVKHSVKIQNTGKVMNMSLLPVTVHLTPTMDNTPKCIPGICCILRN